MLMVAEQFSSIIRSNQRTYTIFLPHTLSGVQIGSRPSVNPVDVLAFPRLSPAGRRVPVIAQQSAEFYMQAV